MGTLVNETTRSQLVAIRLQLENEGWIDRDKSREICDCDRLSARIWDLRHDPIDPMEIETVRVKRKNRFGHWESHAVYKLIEEEPS